MSSSDRGRGDAPGPRHEPAPAGTTSGPVDPTDPYANWLDRMQRARARHAAITKNLYTWSNYKNWADKMRDTFDEGDANAPGVVTPGAGTRGVPAAGAGAIASRAATPSVGASGAVTPRAASLNVGVTGAPKLPLPKK